MQPEDFIINKFGLNYFLDDSNIYYMESVDLLFYFMEYIENQIKLRWCISLLLIFRYLNYSTFTHEYEEYDEEAHPHTRHALLAYLNRKKLTNYKNQILELRAESDHEKKLAAFDQLGSSLN